MIKAEWTTTIIEKTLVSKKFKAWFDTSFGYLYPEIASNFEWETDADDEGPIYIVSNNFSSDMTTEQLYRLFVASKTPKKEKKYFTVPNAVDFYSGKADIVEIDENIAEIVKELNRKGYKTMASCSGHYIEDQTASGYIWIANFPKSPIPKGLKKDKPKDTDKISIRWNAKSLAQLEIKWKLLAKWVKSLPNIGVATLVKAG